MKKIPSRVLTLIDELQSDALYSMLREDLCEDGCSRDVEGSSITCSDCVVQSDNAVAKKELRELLTKKGIRISIVKGD